MSALKCFLLVLGVCALIHASLADQCGHAQSGSQTIHIITSNRANLLDGIRTFQLQIPDGEGICGGRGYAGELVSACDMDFPPGVQIVNRDLAYITRPSATLIGGYTYITYYCLT